MPPAGSSLKSHHVAVIGAGAAGLVAARELQREGHSVVVFERQNQVGGTWVYTEHFELDPFSLEATGSLVHSSVYGSLRTNLPRESMGFTDFPFVPRPDKSGDPRRFPDHREVLAYLQEFAKEFGIEETVRFGTEIVHVGLEENGKWKVAFNVKGNRSSDGYGDEIYDAVVVCTGHYFEPRLADDVPGIDCWPGKQMHSHIYRIPEPFRDQVVVLIGNSASAHDICRDIAAVAKEVHVAYRSDSSETYVKQPGCENLWLHSMIDSTHEDGSVVFQNGKVVFADVIMHCTGYNYHFPFFETNGIVTVDDNRVGPLYKDVFPPGLAPWISFVGLPLKGFTLLISELQSKWIAGVLSGRIKLPSREEMMEDVKAFYSMLESHGIPKQDTHCIGTRYDYYDWLGAQSGSQGIEEWRKRMFVSTIARNRAQPETYRDEWEDDDVVSQAYKDFERYKTVEEKPPFLD